VPVHAILATGHRLVGGGVRSFEPVVADLVRTASKEIQIAAYSFDPSGLALLREIDQRGRTGVRVSIIVRSLTALRHDIRRELEMMSDRYTVVDFSSQNDSLLHTKVLVVDRSDAVLGSANFTFGGLVTNHEIGIWLKGEEAWQVSTLLDKLADS
jgi:phosphatidylserine/phosphatidylglycerophosphate/cardiolipin synthase-like enzyme